MLDAADLPNDIAELKALLIAATALGLRKDDRIARLEKLVAAFKQAVFGRKSEKINPEQFDRDTAYIEETTLSGPAACRRTDVRLIP
jgi:hypothetical protein